MALWQKILLRGISVPLAFVLAATVRGDSLNLKTIPVTATWVAHIDLDAVWASEVTQKLFEESIRRRPAIKLLLRQICYNMSVAQYSDFADITAYGTSFELQTGVLIISAKVRKDIALEKVKDAPGHKRIGFGKHEIHMWLRVDEKKREHLVAGTLYRSNVLVFASSADLLKSALDVLDGKSLALSEKESPLAEKVPEGTIFLARAVGVNRAGIAASRPILQHIERFSYEEGQNGEKWFGKLLVKTDSKLAADNVKEVLDGIRSLVWLNSPDSQAAEMLGDIQFTSQGNTVQMTFDESVDRIVEQAPVVYEAFLNVGRNQGQIETNR